MGLIVARGAIGGRTLPIKSMWDKSWGCHLFNITMPRWRFLKINKFLRFDLKTERRNLEVLLLITETSRNLEEKVLLGIIAVESVFKEFSEGLQSQRKYNHR